MTGFTRETGLALRQLLRDQQHGSLGSLPSGGQGLGGGSRILLAKASASIAQGSSGTVTIYTGDASTSKGLETASSTRTREAYNRFGPDLINGDWCLVTRTGGNGWEIISAYSEAGSSGSGASCELQYALGTIPPTVTALFGNAHQAARWFFPTPVPWLNTQGFSISTLKVHWEDTGTTDWSGGANVNRWQSSIYTRTDGYLSDDYVFHVVEDSGFGFYAWLELEAGTGNGTMDDELYLVWRCMHPATPQPNYENKMELFFGTNGTKTKADDPSFVVPTGKFFTECCLNPGYDLYDLACFGIGAVQIPGEFSLNMPVASGTELQTFALDMPDDCTYHPVGATCSGGRSDSSRIVITQTGQLSAGGTVYVSLVIAESVGPSDVFLRAFKTADLSQSQWDAVLAQGYVDVTYFTSTLETGTTANCHDANPPTMIRLYFT